MSVFNRSKAEEKDVFCSSSIPDFRLSHWTLLLPDVLAEIGLLDYPSPRCHDSYGACLQAFRNMDLKLSYWVGSLFTFLHLNQESPSHAAATSKARLNNV